MKKCIAFLVLIMVFFSLSASANEIYSYTTQKIMTDGVTVKNIQRFYSDYSLNINLVTADLKNKFLSLELLKSGKGVDKTDTTLNLAKGEEGVVAAVNGDFFSKYKGDQNFSLGIEIKDGEMLQSHINSDMAAGLVKDKLLSLSYITMDASVKCENGSTLKITHINKPTDYYGALLMYTPDFNGKTSPFLPVGISAVTVENGVVSAKGISLGGTIPIPENGYILVIDDNMTPMLDMNLNIGDRVELKVEATPSIENIETAFGGGTLLVKDGQKTPITHNVSGNNPRTVIGTNGDGTVLYMMTVDGRQTISRGVSLDALQNLCIELGIKNAINMDGGGSTALVGKTTDNGELHTINSPSENRKVINAIGIKTSAEPGEAVSFDVKVENTCVLAGDSVKIFVNALDENKNKAQSIPKKLVWKVVKGSGKVIDNVFYPESTGEAVLELYYGNVWQSSCTFNVFSKNDIAGIDINPVYLVKKGQTVKSSTFARVFDRNGNFADVKKLGLLSPEYDKSFLAVNDTEIKVLKEGAGNLTLSCGGARKSARFICEGFGVDFEEAQTLDALKKDEKGSFSFNIVANAPKKTFFTRLSYARAMDSFKNAGSVSVLGEEISVFTPEGVKVITGGKFGEFPIKNGRVITLALKSSNTLRTNSQWQKLTSALKNAKEKNIFILLNEELYLKDELEGRVFGDVLADLAKNKNVFVVSAGTENNVKISRGVRFITLAGAEDYTGVKSAIKGIKYLSFNLDGENATYFFRNIY